MNMDNNDDTNGAGELSRRRLLLSGACAAGASIFSVAAPVRALADIQPVIPKKASQEKAGYQPVATFGSWRKCSTCRHFEAPNACHVVEGVISPDGRCRLYVRRWAEPSRAI